MINKKFEGNVNIFLSISFDICFVALKNLLIDMVLLSTHNIIQLMHSFEVDFRICQPENSDVHRGEAEVNSTFEG